jgi:hypothetical protein
LPREVFGFDFYVMRNPEKHPLIPEGLMFNLNNGLSARPTDRPVCVSSGARRGGGRQTVCRLGVVGRQDHEVAS